MPLNYRRDKLFVDRCISKLNLTLSRFFAGYDVKLSTVEKVTKVLGLDFVGREELNNLRQETKKQFLTGEY